MTDVKRHLPLHWVSLFIFEDYNDNHDNIIKWIKTNGEFFSYQKYSEILGEDAHISYRIAFSDPSKIEELEFFLQEELDEMNYMLHGYDEEPHVKFAYVLGTKLYENIKRLDFVLDSSPTYDFMVLILHGMFNNLGFSYKDEARFYTYATSRILQQMGE